MVRRVGAQWLKLRRLFPDNGRAYELFDGAVLLLLVSLFSYVLAPTETLSSRTGLEPLQFVSQQTFGWIIFVASLAAAACSYGDWTWVTRGYTIAITASLVLTSNFVWAWARTLDWAGLAEPGIGSWRPDAGLITDQTMWVPLGSACLYGWVARKLMRDNLRACAK